MRELPDLAEVRAAWIDQPEEEVSVDGEGVYGRRTRELYSTTRSEVKGSIVAALFFASVVAWRFAPERDRLVLFGCAAVMVWAAVTVYRFRSSIRRNPPRPDAFARTGVEHYRAELMRRRDHLRSGWIWRGPLWLAGIVAGATLARRNVPGRLWDAFPAIVLLAGWAAFGVRRRLRDAAEVQQEIDELS
uniref:Uncharacterized protein n=1 Tax=Solibacter usitatus (strain Ellin6076) TaxID=234267 RepID=Q028U4_SOLUE